MLENIIWFEGRLDNFSEGKPSCSGIAKYIEATSTLQQAAD